MTINKAILAMGIAAIMVFAGVAAFAGDADAADGEYKVTYSYDGNSIVANTVDGKLTLAVSLDAAFGAGVVSAPEGYEFAGKWSAGATVYAAGTEYTFIQDVVLTPTFTLKDGFGIVTLVYGDISEDYLVEDPYAITDEDLADFAEKTGLALAVDGGAVKLAGTDFELKGFKTGTADPTLVLNDIKTTSKATTVFTLVVEPIYTVAFSVDGVTVGGFKSNVPTIAKVIPSVEKDNYKFLGWTIDGQTTYTDDQVKAFVPTSDVVFTAVFEPLPYNVTFVAEGQADIVRTALYGNEIDAPALPEGCKFWGDADGKEVTFPYTVLGAVTFTAVPYEVYTVTFMAGDEVIGTADVVEGNVLAADQIPALPAGFKAWGIEAGAEVAADVTVTAEAIVMYTVTFDYKETAYGTNGFTTVQVEEGAVVELPAVPDVYTGVKKWDYDGAPVTKDMTIPLIDIPYFTVTFMAGDVKVGEVSVKEGEVAAVPELPEGYAAWNYDGAAIFEDTVITAEAAVKAVYNVTFLIDGKAPVTQKSDSLTLPDSTREGYEFQGWVVAGASSYVDPLTYPYIEDTTFTAVYKAVAPAAPAEPGFLDTTSGQITAIIAVMVVLFVAALLVAPASPVNYKVIRDKVAEKKAAKEAAKKP